jgi:hypothetical protein
VFRPYHSTRTTMISRRIYILKSDRSLMDREKNFLTGILRNLALYEVSDAYWRVARKKLGRRMPARVWCSEGRENSG